MKNKILMLFNLFLWLNLSLATGQTVENQLVKNKLEKINAQLANDFKQKNMDNILSHFDKEAVLMPEFQPTMRGTEVIKAYYQEIFTRWEIEKFDKKIIEIITFNDNFAEVGTFTLAYRANNQDFTLNGKYLNIWKTNQAGVLKKKAVSYGYFHQVENPATHWVKIAKESFSPKPSSQTSKSNPLAFELNALNALMEKSIQARDGNLRADFYTDDAIFMPFADSSKVGINSIRAHLIAYNSYPVKIDSINIYHEDFEDCNSFVIEYSRFYVKWHTADNAGVGAGKGIRIWKREKNCSLKLYREIGLHDHLETNADLEKIKIELQKVNQSYSAALIQKNLKVVMNYYTKNSVVMPEFHSALYHQPAIKKYFATLFSEAQIEGLQKEIYEVKMLKDMILEIGTYQLRQKSKANIKGKYMIVWERNKQGKLQINTEAWGSTQYIERHQAPYAENPRAEHTQYPTPTSPNPALVEELARQNSFIHQHVLGRDGGTHAAIFTEDAIFMHYYQPLILGMDKIKLYLIAHESPKVSVDSLQIKASKIIDLGDFVIEHGYYSVNWSDGINGGKGIGKSINIWKREEKGVLKIYRQMVNHD